MKIGDTVSMIFAVREIIESENGKRYKLYTNYTESGLPRYSKFLEIEILDSDIADGFVKTINPKNP